MDSFYSCGIITFCTCVVAIETIATVAFCFSKCIIPLSERWATLFTYVCACVCMCVCFIHLQVFVAVAIALWSSLALWFSMPEGLPVFYFTVITIHISICVPYAFPLLSLPFCYRIIFITQKKKNNGITERKKRTTSHELLILDRIPNEMSVCSLKMKIAKRKHPAWN